MRNYSISGLNILIDGIDNQYFNTKMLEYTPINSVKDIDINITFKRSDSIKLPKGKAVANVNQRLWMRSPEGHYLAVDIGNADPHLTNRNNIYLINGRPMPPVDTHLSLIDADKEWRNIKIDMFDIEPYCDVPAYIRSFNIIGEAFRYAVLMHSGVVIHSSAISYNGKGILFSAPSGTGKSTHAGLWSEYYPKTKIINDDSPAVRMIDGRPTVFGTPWSGKVSLNSNISAPLSAIVFLEQAEENSIEEINGYEAINRLLNEIRKPVFEELMLLILDYISDIINNVPIYLLRCSISRESVELVRNKIDLL